MNADPYSIGWRMGAGEDHIIAFGTWWASVANDEPARIEWVRRWSPPGSWLPWAARLIWPDQERAEDVDIVRRLEALGIGSVAAWEDAEREDEAAFEAELASRPRSARE